MRYRRPRLARPLYESLPGLYAACGLAALALSYRERSASLGIALGIGGLAGVLAGTVVWLRRRGHRRMLTQYDQPDALSPARRESKK